MFIYVHFMPILASESPDQVPVLVKKSKVDLDQNDQNRILTEIDGRLLSVRKGYLGAPDIFEQFPRYYLSRTLISTGYPVFIRSMTGCDELSSSPIGEIRISIGW